VNTPDALNKLLKELPEKSGPTFIHAKINTGGRRDFKRPKDLVALAARFRSHFGALQETDNTTGDR